MNQNLILFVIVLSVLAALSSCTTPGGKKMTFPKPGNVLKAAAYVAIPHKDSCNH